MPGLAQLPDVATLKHFQTERFKVFYTGEMREHARDLADDGETYLNQLSARWAVILPKQKITLTFGAPRGYATSFVNHLELPDWLEAAYDTAHHRVELRILKPAEFEYGVAREAMEHCLIHAMLNLPKMDRMPTFWEEGLAMHYGGGDATHQRFFAIVGFQKFKKTEALVNDPSWVKSQEDFFYGSAIAHYFVTWLWERRPEGEAVFMQSLFLGMRWQDALVKAGFKDVSGLAIDFDFYIRPKYKLYTMIFTRDFWGILLSVAWLGLVVVKLRKAFLVARMPHTTIVRAESEVSAADFKGPAFGLDAPKTSMTDPEDEPTLNLTPRHEAGAASLSGPSPVVNPPRPQAPPVSPPPRPVQRDARPVRPQPALPPSTKTVTPPPRAPKREVTPPPPPGSTAHAAHHGGPKPPAPKPMDWDDAFGDLDGDLDAAFAELEKDDK